MCVAISTSFILEQDAIVSWVTTSEQKHHEKNSVIQEGTRPTPAGERPYRGASRAQKEYRADTIGSPHLFSGNRRSSVPVVPQSSARILGTQVPFVSHFAGVSRAHIEQLSTPRSVATSSNQDTCEGGPRKSGRGKQSPQRGCYSYPVLDAFQRSAQRYARPAGVAQAGCRSAFRKLSAIPTKK